MKLDDHNRDAWEELSQAIRDDDPESVASLLSKNPELLHVHTRLGSCVHLAAYEGHLDIVQLLVRLGADINLVPERGISPLDEAASTGRLEVVQYLVQQGASLDVSRPGRTPLFSAIYGGHTDVVRFLLEAGMDPHVVYRGKNGRLQNALSFAQEYERTEIAELLLKAGCRLPVEGVDKPAWKPEKIYQPTAADRAHQQITARMAEEFGPVDPLAMQEIVPVHPEVHVAIHVIRPNERHPFLTLFTTGMSDRAMSVPEGQEEYQYAELVMHLPATWPHPRDESSGSETIWPCEWLRKVAYYPHLNGTWLGGRWTIISSDDPPVPLGPNTKQTCLLLLADFADWSPMLLDDGKRVHFCTVIPIYTEERDFEKKDGIVPLLQRLQERGYTTVVSVNRANVARS